MISCSFHVFEGTNLKGYLQSPDEMYLGSFIGRVALRRQQYLFSIAQVFVLTTHNHKVNIKQRIIEDHILTTKT